MSGDACRSCGSPIRWAMTEKGKRMPLDTEPAADGNVTLTPMPGGFDRAKVWGDRSAMPLGPRYVSHFASCPLAGRHRRR